MRMELVSKRILWPSAGMNAKKAANLVDEALALHQNLKHEEAEAIYEQVRQARPKDFDPWYLSGSMAYQDGNPEKAIKLLEHARRLDAQHDGCRLFLGMAYADLQHWEEAGRHLAKALKRIDKYPEAWDHLARSQEVAGKMQEALATRRKAVELWPERATSWRNLGLTVARVDGVAAAERHFRKATELEPEIATHWSNLGVALSEIPGRLGAAMQAMDRALAEDPFSPEARRGRALLYQRLYRLEEAFADVETVLATADREARDFSSRCLSLHYFADRTDREILRAHKEFQRFLDYYPDPGFGNEADPEKKLRVGFVSPDLRRHSVAIFLEPLLRHLSREKFAIYLYHSSPKEDAVSQHLRSLSVKWTNIYDHSDEVAENLMRKDALDVVVDLAGHFAQNRLPLLARRVAPVQVTYLGYPDTTGLQAITHRLVDKWTDPAGESEERATENLLRFSDCAWCYAPSDEAPEPQEPDASHPITFGSFNNFLKCTPQVLALWGRILQAVPDSQLFIKCANLEDPDAKKSVEEKITGAGIALERVLLQGMQEDMRDHLAHYAKVDVALDPFPYNGTTTTCEALWMGVPVVSLVGARHSARVGLSLLAAVGRAEWATANEDAYVAQAVELAQQSRRIPGAREALREQMRTSILCAAEAQATRFGEALRSVWREWCAPRQNGHSQVP